jgi:preprotein translocase subunit YajC
MPPLSPRSSRDPRVLSTGRDNLRILVMAVIGVIVLVGFFFFQRYAQRAEESAKLDAVAEDPLRAAEIAREREAAASAASEVRSELRRRFEGAERIEQSLSAEQDAALAEIAARLARVGSGALRWVEREPTARIFDASEPSTRRGAFHEVHGTLLGDTWTRPVGGVSTVVGLLRPELELGRLADRPIAFVARFLSDGEAAAADPADAGERTWRDGTWVRLQGLYVCDFSVWGRLPSGGTAPLLVAGEVTPSEPSSALRGDLTQAELNAAFEYLDAYFPSRHNGGQHVRENLPIEVQDDVFLTFAQMALVHGDEPFDENAELLFKEMLKRFYDDPQAERGKRFKIEGRVGRVEEVLVGSNPFRLERKQFLFVGGRYGWLWIESPKIFDVKVEDVVEIEAYFASRIWYHSRDGELDRPYFVARALRPFRPKESAGADFWETYLPSFLLASTLGLFAFFFFILFRDRKRSEAAQAKLIEMRRRRRGKRPEEPVSGG